MRMLLQKGRNQFFSFGSSIEFAEKSRERIEGAKVAQLGHAQSQLKRATTPPKGQVISECLKFFQKNNTKI